MKKIWMCVLALILMLPVPALAEGPVLLIELPEGAQMTESVEFEDGDFIQSYQMGGVQAQLLRYAGFDMTLDDLVASDWAENCGVEPLSLTGVSGYPAQGARIMQAIDESGYPVSAAGGELSEGQRLMEIRLVLVQVGDCALIYQDMRMEDEEETLPSLDSLKVQTEELEVG